MSGKSDADLAVMLTKCGSRRITVPLRDRRSPYDPHSLLQAAFQGDPKNPQDKVSACMTPDMTQGKLIINRQTFTHDTVHLIPKYIRSRVESKPCIESNESVIPHRHLVCAEQ